MAASYGSLVMEVISLDNGRFAVRETGGNAMQRTVADFPTQAEAEEWMLSQTNFGDGGSNRLKPGDGEDVA